MDTDKNKTAKAIDTPPGLIPVTDPAAVNPAIAEACKQILAALKADTGKARAISNEDFIGIMTVIGTLYTALKDLAHTFHPGEEKRMVGAGVKNLGFIYSALSHAATDEKTLPSYVSIEEWRNATVDFLYKRDILLTLRDMENMVRDTMMWSGDESYHDAVRYYNYVHEGARQDAPGMKAIYDRLHTFFRRTKAAKDTVTEEQAERDLRALLHGTKDGEVLVRNVRPVSAGGEREIVDDVAK